MFNYEHDDTRLNHYSQNETSNLHQEISGDSSFEDVNKFLQNNRLQSNDVSQLTGEESPYPLIPDAKIEKPSCLVTEEYGLDISQIRGPGNEETSFKDDQTAKQLVRLPKTYKHQKDSAENVLQNVLNDPELDKSAMSSLMGSFANLGRPSDLNEDKVICNEVLEEQQMQILIGRNQSRIGHTDAQSAFHGKRDPLGVNSVMKSFEKQSQYVKGGLNSKSFKEAAAFAVEPG